MTGHQWEQLYHKAVLETDWSIMEERIQAAEAGIKERLHEFSLNQVETSEENRAIADALSGLRSLRSDVAAWRGDVRVERPR